MFHWLGPARARIHTQTQHTPGDLGNACLGHVEVCVAVAQPESRSTSSSTSPLSAQGDQIPCTQPSHTKKPLRTPKWDVRTRNFRKNTTEKGGNGKEDCIPLREDFVSSFRDFGALIFLFFFNALVFSQCSLGLTLAPTCRSDDGSSEPRWPWPLLGVCARAAGGCFGTGPVQRSVRAALPDPVLLYRDYSGLSRPRAPQRAQEHTPQRGETVSTKRGKALTAPFCFNLRPTFSLQITRNEPFTCVSVMLNNKSFNSMFDKASPELSLRQSYHSFWYVFDTKRWFYSHIT